MHEIQANVHWWNSSGLPRAKWRLGLHAATRKWLQPIERSKSKTLSSIFLLTAFHKAGKWSKNSCMMLSLGRGEGSTHGNLPSKGMDSE